MYAGDDHRLENNILDQSIYSTKQKNDFSDFLQLF